MLKHDDFDFTEVCYFDLPGEGGPEHESRTGVTRPEDESVPIADLIYPHRYDIQIRAEYVHFCIEHADLWLEDRMEFMQKARRETYAGFSHDMLTFRWQWWTTGETPNQCPHHEAFAVDTIKLMRLVPTIQQGVWRSGSRIQIIRAQTLLPAVNGQMVEGNMFLGDGQHRTAVLHALGYTHLLPGQYEFLEYAEYAPFVTTDMYEALGIVPANFKEKAHGLD